MTETSTLTSRGVVGQSTAGTLGRALWWRVRKEGIGIGVVFPLILGVFFELVATIPIAAQAGSSGTMPTGGGFHGTPPSFSVLGASSGSITIITALLTAPAAATFACGMAAGMCVSGILASEVNSGSVELWLSRLRPRAIISGLLRVITAMIGLVWIGMLAITTVLLVVLAVSLRQSLTVTPGYVATVVLIPLVLAVTGAALAVGIGLWKPGLAQVSNGIAHGQGAVLVLIAFGPCFILGIVSFVGVSAGLPLLAIGGIGLGISILLAVAAVIVGVTRISRDSIVSSL